MSTARATVIAAVAHEDEARRTAGWPARGATRTTCSPARCACSTARSTPTRWPARTRCPSRSAASTRWWRGWAGDAASRSRTAAGRRPSRSRSGRPKRRRAEALRPQERLAALLGGRDRPLVAESLALRARLDLDHGREREAALQLRVALEAGIAELEDAASADELAQRLAELREQRDAVGAAANAALRGPLDSGAHEAVAHALGRLEAALRARAMAALDAPIADATQRVSSAAVAKTVFITGASSGIGRALALELAGRGYDLFLTARRMDVLEQVRTDIAAADPARRVEVRQLDVTDDVDVAAAIAEAAEKLGRCDIVVANAGLGSSATGG